MGEPIVNPPMRAMITAPDGEAAVASSTVEDYLKQLYLEQHEAGDGHTVATGRLAGVMGVTPGTATAMLKALAGNGLVAYETRRGARLTDEGERRALNVLRRHRLMELFLVRILGLDWSEVHEEAEALEHVLSDRVLDRIDAMVGYPTVDPHGDPIPGRHRHEEGAAQASLADCPLDQPQQVSRIRHQTPDFLRFVEREGLMPGVQVVVEAREAQAESVRIRAASRGPSSLGLAAAAKILVLPV
jgi:DtxR family Mn-dependent transcriptional regulator